MAKKKVTKKTRASSARSAATRSPARKKPAKPSKKKNTVKKVAKKQTTARASTKKTTKKKVAVKPVAKKVATTSKKAPTAKAGARTRKKTPARKSISKAEAARIAAVTPDANGYVIINGRRIRMMSAIVEVVTPKKSKSSAKNPSAPLAAAVTDKPVKTKLKKKDLDHYRDMLLDRRRELVGDLNSMEKQALHSGGGGLSHMPIHMADVGTDTFDQDFMLGLAEGERRRLREIDAALQRVRDRTYGICETTRKPIPKARLNAKPWARYTIEAARQVERGIGE